MSGGVYLLSAFTCLLCAAMLFRGYRRSGVRLLFWSSLCFLGLMVENLTGYVDMVILPEVSMVVWRKLPGLFAIVLLLFGLIWDSK